MPNLRMVSLGYCFFCNGDEWLVDLFFCGDVVSNAGGEHDGPFEPHEIPEEMKKIIEYFFV
jgi:hypothetical protein